MCCMKALAEEGEGVVEVVVEVEVVEGVVEYECMNRHQRLHLDCS